MSLGITIGDLRIPRFSADPLTASLAFSGKRIRCSGREPSSDFVGGKGGDAKTFAVLEPLKPKLNGQGLRWFSFFNFAPAYHNAMPFYFHTGLIDEGLIPGRDQDQAAVAFALGNYSYNKILADYSAGRTVQTYESVLEFDYRIEVNRWAFVQPFLQYLIRPNGTGLVQNAAVLGLHFGVEF
jgi:porin